MNERPTHLDLFSGIGGFAIAAQWAGFETVAFCESDSRCREFLGRTWGLPVEPDIKKLDGRRYAGISLLTGGPPCQPASRAGEQGGAGDDRWLWPDSLRMLGEAQPDCFVFENPLGIGDLAEFGILPPVDGSGAAIGDIGDTFNHNGCGVFDKIMGDIGAHCYEAQIFDIPACAVDSPQLRHRYWIVGFRVADANEGRLQERRAESGRSDEERNGADKPDAIPESIRGGHLADTTRHSERGIRETAGTDRERVGQSGQPDSGDMADSAEPGREGRDAERAPDGSESLVADSECQRREQRSEQSESQPARNRRPGFTGDREDPWSNAIWVPCADGKLRRAPDDSFELVTGLHRSLLGALGNSIVPQEAYEILRAIRPLVR